MAQINFVFYFSQICSPLVFLIVTNEASCQIRTLRVHFDSLAVPIPAINHCIVSTWPPSYFIHPSSCEPCLCPGSTPVTPPVQDCNKPPFYFAHLVNLPSSNIICWPQPNPSVTFVILLKPPTFISVWFTSNIQPFKPYYSKYFRNDYNFIIH